MSGKALWRYAASGPSKWTVSTAYFDPKEDVDVADCWREDVAKEIVRLHNETAMRVELCVCVHAPEQHGHAHGCGVGGCACKATGERGGWPVRL